MDVSSEVQEFYNQVGWTKQSDGFYQNARYEDLRPVSADYIHRCHLRVKKHLPVSGQYLLDAGSGPIQYPEYIKYSQNYQYRVCVDLSIVALQEARKQIGDHGLFVVADVTRLPFLEGVFPGIVSLHTFHHIPLDSQMRAYEEVYRTMAAEGRAVVVNGWTDPWLMRISNRLVQFAERWGNRWNDSQKKEIGSGSVQTEKKKQPVGTFINKMNPEWLKNHLQGKISYQIFCWRSINVRFMRALIHGKIGGSLFLKLLFWLEDIFPHWFGKNGQYPLIVLYKD